MDKNISISSLNVRGLRYGPKRISVFKWINENNIDIACLQETYCTNTFESKFSRLWNGKVYHSVSNSSHARGVCIMIKKECSCKVLNVTRDDAGRKVMVNIEIDNVPYSVVSIYCPNNISERIEFLNSTINWINEYKSSNNLIIAGDVNCVTAVYDRASKLIDKSSATLIQFMSNLNLSDMWRKLNPEIRDYTYIDPTTRHSDSRIDVVMLSDGLVNYAQICEHRYAPVPDHKAVILKLCTSPNKRGKGYWKLNVSLLADDKYVQDVKDIIKKTVIEHVSVVNIGIVWEMVKIRVKEYSIFYSQKKAKNRDNKIKNIENELIAVDKKITESHETNSKLYEERKVLKDNLDLLYYEKAVGAQIRSRSKWVEEGERATSYFLNLEKQHQSNNCIYALCENNITYHKDEDILRIAENFYNEVFRSRNVTTEKANEFMSRIDMQTLPDNDKSLCDAPLTENECLESMKVMKKNKAPGDDGLPIEFYLKFWDDIKSVLLKVYNESYSEGILPESLRQSVISLIYKKGDATNISNYRPISLTNTDYRVLAFMLATRLQKVIDNIIDPNQVAYIKGRFIGTNIRLIIDTIEKYKQDDDEGLLVFLDFTKAFDSIEWNFLFSVLKRFGFGDTFVQWIKVLYQNPCAVVKNNGYFSDPILIKRGVRQGCPVSALLFILCMEVLALYINQNDDLKGLSLSSDGDNCIKICQYADDNTLFLNNENELDIAINLLNKFGEVAGTKLNLSKCEGLWIGRSVSRQIDCKLGNIKWPTKPIKYLGIYVGHDDNECVRLNWDDKIDNLENTLDKWKRRDITLFGKICIIKSVALSKLMYSAAVLCVPDTAVKAINRQLFRYLWGKKDRIKRKVLRLSVQQGGLNMLDVQLHFDALKATWVNRILLAKDSDKWSVIPKQKMSKLCFKQEKVILYTTFKSQKQFPQIVCLPKFYQEVICSYNKSKSVSKEHFSNNILDQPLWGNQHLVFQGKTLWFRNWIESGILTVRDVDMINGKPNIHTINNRIINKSDIFREVHILSIALKPYNIPNNVNNDILDQPIYVNNDIPLYQISNKKSNFFYQNMILADVEKPSCLEFWTTNSPILITVQVFNNICYKKVKAIKDLKLAETNFKILHNILPCNSNLYRWKLKTYKQCDICGEIETVHHLLFECSYAQAIWKDVENVLGIKITLAKVLFGLDLADDLNYVISIVCYCIYKEWLICSFEQNQRKRVPSLRNFKNDMLFRKQVYENMHKNNFDAICILLNHLVSYG